MGSDARELLCNDDGVERSLMADENKTILELGYRVEAEGLKEGTDAYDRRLRQVKVEDTTLGESYIVFLNQGGYVFLSFL